MKLAALSIFISLVLCIVSCDLNPYDPMCHVRLVELQDSLRSYRDSLHDAQRAWSFNSVTAVVVLEDHVIRLGDSCRAEVIIGAANTSYASSMGYRYVNAKLDVSEVTSPKVEEKDMRWIVSFKPNRLGEDSLKGAIVLDGRSGNDPIRLNFAHAYKVVPQ